MNQNILWIGLLIGALFFLRRPTGSAVDPGFYSETAKYGNSAPGTFGGWGEG